MIRPTLAVPSFAGVSDEELMEGLKNRNEIALHELRVRFGRVLRSIVDHTLVEENEADDVVQDTFLQIWKQAHYYSRQCGRPLGWIITVARRRAIDRLRRRHSYGRALENFKAHAAETMDRAMQPIALLVPPGVVEVGKAGHGAHVTAGAHKTSAPPRSARAPRKLTPRISRLDAIAAARKGLGREPVIHANGYMCRESFSLGDRPENFYMIGSMGLASAIGLGFSLTNTNTPTVVLDGDGNLLMNLGILPLAAALQPRRFVHIVFDNEVYGSTGSQRSITTEIRLDRMAEAAGYRTVAAVTEADEITEAVRTALDSDGPHFILAKVTAEDAEVPRIPYTPHQLRDRFRASVRA